MEKFDVGSFEYYTKIVDGIEVVIPKPEKFEARYCRGIIGNWYDLKEKKEMPDGWEPKRFTNENY